MNTVLLDRGQSGAMRDVLSYRVLDSFEIFLDGKVLPFKQTKLKAILAWFCLSGQTHISRARLADMLWSGSNEEKSRGSLRNILYLLRDTPLKPGVLLIDSDREKVFANFDYPPNEVVVALNALDGGEVGPLRALSLVDADLRFATNLFGLDEEFDTFLRTHRDRTLAGMADALRGRLRDDTPPEAARILAQKLRELIPHDETATRHLMLLDIAAGNSAAALEHYNRLWAVLEDEFDVEPSEATQALAVRVKSQGAPPSAPVAIAATPLTNTDRITVYLRPVTGSGLSNETRMVIDGMHAEIVSSLLAVEDWVVIEADSETPLPGQRGSYELRSVFSPGIGEVRLILTLKDLFTGEMIWTQALPVNRADWIRNSELAVQRLASHLIGRVETHYVTRLGPIEDRELPDYDKLIRARWLMNDWTAEADRRAEDLMRGVNHGGELGLRARIRLAELLNSRSLIFPGLYAPREGVAEALRIAEGCVADNAQRADAWLALAWAAVQSGLTDRATDAAEFAILGSQSSPRRIASAAEVLALSGQTERAATLSAAVGVMDPGVNRLTLAYRVSVALLAGDYQSCLDLAQQANGAIVLGHAYAAASAALLGDNTTARALWQRFGDDLAQRWQGPGLADPMDWFLRATPIQPGPNFDAVAGALRGIS